MKRGAVLLPVGILVVVFGASRLLYTTRGPGVGGFSVGGGLAAQARAALSGGNFEVGTLERGMPLLDARLLREDLWRSLYYLHSQPPLFNLFVAGLLRAPDFARTYQYVNWALALALYLTTYALMRRLGISAGVALPLTILFLLSPNAAWMESAVYYGLPLALALVLAVFCLDRAVEGRGLGWFATYCALIAMLPLSRAFFTLAWCVLAAAFGAAVVWRQVSAGASPVARRRKILFLACAPVLVAVAFQTKQFLLFGQLTGSSWLGCNLTTMTAGMRAARQAELARGRVSPLVNVYRNDTVEVYRRYFSVPPTGVPALDEARKVGGEPNFNNAIYLPVGRQYLKDSLHLISRHPLIYLANVANSVYIFSGYQIGISFDHPEAFFARWKWYELAAPLVGFPLIVWAVATGIRSLRRDRLSPDRRPMVAFLVANVIYVALVSCLIEKSEGPVYRFQVDAFLWALLGLAVTAVLAKWRQAGAAS